MSEDVERFGERLKAAAGTRSSDDVEADKWRADVAARLFGAPARKIRIGRFEVVRRVGGGATGVVYEAHDPQLERRVAIKLLRPGAAIPLDKAEQWLAREAKTLAKLSHPNVVPVYDVGTHDDQVFIALEYVAGATMREWMADSPSWPEVVDVFVQAAQGLAAAHAAGVVHRDFKPENVLIGDDGRVRVSDFGIARRLDDGARTDGEPLDDTSSEDVRDATTHRAAGTPSYMAPEQFLGDPVDARTDQFGFCVALHEALYGSRPFAGTTRQTLAANVIAGRRRTPEIAQPPPVWLDRVIARGLSVDPAQRFASMDALLSQLQRRPGKRRLAIGLAFAAGVAATAALAVTSSEAPASPCGDAEQRLSLVWNANRAGGIRQAFEDTQLSYAPDTATRITHALDGYGTQWKHAYAGACRGVAEDVAMRRMHCLQSRLLELDSLVTELSTADRAAVEHSISGVASLLDPAACEHAATPQSRHPASGLEADALREQIANAKAKKDAGHPREALPLARDAARRAQDLGDPTLSAEALLVAGQTERALLGMIARNEAQATIYAAVLAAQAAGRPDIEARAMVEYLGVNESIGELDRVMEWEPRVREAVAKVGDPPELVGRIEYTLALASSFRGHQDQAEAHAEASLAQFMKGGPGAQRFAATTHNLLGELVFGTGDYTAALPHYERALDITMDAFGPNHTWAANAYGNMAEVYHYLGRFREADDLYRRSFRIRLEVYGPTSIWVIHSMAHVADTAMELGEPDRARKVYAEALSQRQALRALVGDKPTDDVMLSVFRDIQAWDQDQWLHYGLALAYLELGELDAAQEHATAIAEPTLPDDRHHPDLIGRLDVLGWIRLAQGRTAEAAAEFRRVLPRLREHYPEDHYILAFSLAGLGQAQLALGQTEAAQASLQDALSHLRRIPRAFPRMSGDLRMALARAKASSGELDAATELARAAHDDYRRAHDRRPGDLDAVEAWLREHEAAEAP